MSVRIARAARSTDAAYAPVAEPFSYEACTYWVSVCVWPAMLPPTIATAPNSPSERAVVTVEEVEREPDDDGGKRHRQVDDRVHQPHAGDAVPHDRERAEDAEDRVERHGDERDLECQLQGMDGERARDRRPERVPPVLERAPENQCDGRDEDHREVRERGDANRVLRSSSHGGSRSVEG